MQASSRVGFAALSTGRWRAPLCSSFSRLYLIPTLRRIRMGVLLSGREASSGLTSSDEVQSFQATSCAAWQCSYWKHRTLRVHDLEVLYGRDEPRPFQLEGKVQQRLQQRFSFKVAYNSTQILGRKSGKVVAKWTRD